METINLRIASERSKVEELYYCVSLKTPPKPELLNLLPCHMQKLEYSIKFRTGILAALDHSITLIIFRECNEPRIGLFVTIAKPQEQIIELRAIEVSFSTANGENPLYSLSRSNPPKELAISRLMTGVGGNVLAVNNQFWTTSSEWMNDTTAVSLTFNIVSRYAPEIINEEDNAFPPLHCSNGNIDIGNYFMNEEFSDFIVTCQSTVFPVHRIILSSRVKYFEAMLASNMKESQEGTLAMDDVTPVTCKELFRFIYQGKVENLSDCAQELIVMADKYGIDDLQNLCERYLFQNLNVENALGVYGLSPVLTRKAKEIILSNKNRFAPDPEALKNFTCQYPELVFDLFKMA